MPRDFFEVLGRIVAVNAQIEYLQDRLNHVPADETAEVRKVEQFRTRCKTGRMERNAVVHSRWVFGGHADPNTILGIRYKTRKATSGSVATVSIVDVPGSEREHDTVVYTVESLKKMLRRDITTMRIGQLAYSEVQLNWATRRVEAMLTVEDRADR